MTGAVRAYCGMVGVLMAVWWSVELRRGALSRGDRRPVEIGLHLTAELLTVGLLLAGALTLRAGRSGVAYVALGMLLYTVIQSPGYFLARREVAPAAMFAGLGLLTVGAMLTLALA